MRLPYGLELTESCRSCTIRTDGFFCHLSAASLRAFESIKYTTAYPEGAVLFGEGQEPRGVFLVCKGRVKLSMTSSEGKTLILRIASPGEILGLNATVSGRPYELSAETLYPCQVNFVKREDFLNFLREQGEACLHAAEQLSHNYHTACEQIRTLGLAHSVPEKLARLLLEWSEEGEATKQGIRLKLALTHEEIETVTRALGDFKTKQFATLKGSTLLIQNKTALENYVGT